MAIGDSTDLKSHLLSMRKVRNGMNFTIFSELCWFGIVQVADRLSILRQWPHKRFLVSFFQRHKIH